ncbi:DNA-binding protein Ewg-like [Diabrotica undecimpunctata]|uniref:DNA-binding protein Ewg-like n=1 Tax=Diabrotica undecimpunctata TaxID=50387 RepID=UPI003B639729
MGKELAGVAAAATVSSKNSERRRERERKRLLRKIEETVHELAIRTGVQVAVLSTDLRTRNTRCLVPNETFRTKHLEDVINNVISRIIQNELETAVLTQAPPPIQEDPAQ